MGADNINSKKVNYLNLLMYVIIDLFRSRRFEQLAIKGGFRLSEIMAIFHNPINFHEINE